MEVRPLWVSKMNTTAQIVLIALVLGEQSARPSSAPCWAVFVLLAAGLTIASAAAYLVEWVRHMASGRMIQGGQSVTVGRQAVFWPRLSLRFCCSSGCSAASCCRSSWGLALAYLLDPIADRLEQAGMSRFWATISIVLMSVLVIAAVILIAVPVLVSQLSGFLERLPVYVEQLRGLANRLYQTRIGQYLGASSREAERSIRWSPKAHPGWPRCWAPYGPAARR
jgi:phosphatidylglycerophosphate synthase